MKTKTSTNSVDYPPFEATEETDEREIMPDPTKDQSVVEIFSLKSPIPQEEEKKEETRVSVLWAQKNKRK